MLKLLDSLGIGMIFTILAKMSSASKGTETWALLNNNADELINKLE